MINPKREWIEFKSEEEKLEKLKELKIISSKSKEVKELYYKGVYTEDATLCDVVGFVDDNEIILNINGEFHSIHPEYFIDMQKKERFIIVDIETPMSFKKEDGIREIAAVVVEDYRVIETLHLAKVIDEEEYKKGYGNGLEAIEENEEYKEKFKKLVKKYKCPLVAHNARFDRKFLLHWGFVDKDQKFYCSLNTIKAMVKLESYKLVNLLSYYGIKDGQDHNAIQDVLDLLELLKKLKPEKWSTIERSSNYGSYKSNDTKEIKEKAPAKFARKSKADREEEKRRLEKAKENIIKNIFDGKKIVFTGDTKKDRIELQELAIMYGGAVTQSVSGKTYMVVIGENPGSSKISKAKDLNVNIVKEEDFLELLK
ncbi:BRCT domain-containing protein [Eubacterium multiforme]|uniref:DNA polymerase III epsilon subunit-like protein n=1 Tax=Eubacterium multiforme TaxID=83339 RepID=A0ABT9UNG0_9FIRM|nr:BRCT domain-containing protein [Eubacterium multiforme]MDQ0148180.1 DNA polymerase III epsilon subunit-like protein [Eubacterium multiforme]